MSESDTNESPTTGNDDQREKFREALERKRGKQAAGQANADGGSKVRGSHAAAATQRTFRRKSGG